MRLRDIEALCATIVPGSGGVQIDALSRGLVNESYRVTRDRIDYSLRMSVADGSLIALDRAWEAKLLRTAAAADLAPVVRFEDVERGILLSDWLPGNCWQETAVGDRSGPEVIARLLRRVHVLSIPQPPHRMNPAAWLEHYETKAAGTLPRRSAATAHLQAWAALPAAPAVVCHGDLHALNIVQSAGVLRLLDWEYAHVSDAYWDVAGWCASEDLNPAARRRLLACYLGREPTPIQSRRLALLLWLYDYVCLQWGMLYLNKQPSGSAAAATRVRVALLDARLSIPAN